MPFLFGRGDPRRAELERLRQEILERKNEIAVLETSAREEEAEHPEAQPAPGQRTPDIYTSVSRLRVTMVRRELRLKQQELEELVKREAALAQTLRVRPMKAEARPPAAAPGNGRAVSPSTAASPAPARPAAAAAPPRRDGMTGGVRIGPQARQRRPPRELHFRAASINLLNLALSLAAIVLTLVVGLVLSGLLDVDPSRDYGLLSPIARALQALLASFAGGRY